MQYQGISLKREFQIQELFSLHYFEYSSTFSFPGESHDFWEFICVDKGEVSIGTGRKSHLLRKGEIAFYEPNEFHWAQATGKTAPSLIVISFSCQSPSMDFFRGKILRVDEIERGILAKLIGEASDYLDDRLDDPYQTILHVNPNAFPMAGQMIQIYLEQLLIHLYRRHCSPEKKRTVPLKNAENITKKNRDAELFQQVTRYMSQNLSKQLTIEKICYDNLIGRSRLQKVFHEKSGHGIIEHFSQMKIEAAKQLIRSAQMNFSQISEELGYSSIHYFSRQFKKIAGMTPSEYASTIKAISERNL